MSVQVTFNVIGSSYGTDFDTSEKASPTRAGRR